MLGIIWIIGAPSATRQNITVVCSVRILTFIVCSSINYARITKKYVHLCGISLQGTLRRKISTCGFTISVVVQIRGIIMNLKDNDIPWKYSRKLHMMIYFFLCYIYNNAFHNTNHHYIQAPMDHQIFLYFLMNNLDIKL